jgi:16S rRNA (guanine966-N2)-methyltransferase
MNIRVIAGLYGGRIIEGSNSDKTHPMSERIRNALFNKISSEIDGADVLDAFAGSGALGLEALSRGAKKVTFVERDQTAQKIIQNNIEILGVEGRSILYKEAVSKWVQSNHKLFDIILVDPPYDNPQLSTVS